MRETLGLQVRAGEGESEAEGYVLTNPVAKTSMSSGLSSKGKAQVDQIHSNSTVASHDPNLLMKHLFICRQPFQAQHAIVSQSVQAARRSGLYLRCRFSLRRRQRLKLWVLTTATAGFGPASHRCGFKDGTRVVGPS